MRVLTFHFILFLENIQILLFTFHGVELVLMNSCPSEGCNNDDIFDVSGQVDYINFQNYIFENPDKTLFPRTYCAITLIVIVFFFGLYAASSKWYEKELQLETRDLVKYLLKMSLLCLSLLIYVFQTPILTMATFAFFCDEA